MMMSNERFEDEQNFTMIEETDPIADYRQSLSELVFNSKPHILMLTMLAEDYKDSKAPEIVECIEQRLYQVTSEKKLPTLYLIDSICKNLQSSSYVELFQKKIIKIFCHTFERADDKIRVFLYKLRQTWNVIFSQEVLYNLDMAVHKIDQGWPISKASQKPTENGKKVAEENKKIAPKDAEKKPEVCSKSDLSSQVLLKQNELLSLQRQRIELELRKEILSVTKNLQQGDLGVNQSSNTNSINKNEPNKRKPITTNTVGSNPGSLKSRKKELNERNKAQTSMDSKKNLLSKKTKQKVAVKRKAASQNHAAPSKINKKNAAEQQMLPLLPAPDDVIPLGRDHHVSVAKWSKPDNRPHRNESSIKSRRRSRSPPVNSSSRNRSSPLRSSDTNTVPHKNSTSTVQTNIPAPNVFAQPEYLFGFQSMADNSTSKPSQEQSWNSQSEPSNQSSSFGMDRDYRHEFDAFMSEAQNKLNTGAISTADHEILVREAEKQLYEMQNNQPQNPFNQNYNHSVPPQVPQPPVSAAGAVQQQNMFPGLVEPNGSVVLFINNELRRLYYIDNIISLVLLKVHPDTPFDQLVSCDPLLLEPKQVFFSGMTTTVYIDRGQASEQCLRLEFNESMPATFFIHGIPQRIMLGLPARELIVNGHPYQVTFGGPPINIFIECDGKFHTFQLSDSRPLLKFSDDLRCDLWLRLVNEAKAKAGFAPPPQPHSTNFGYAPAPVPGPLANTTYPNTMSNNTFVSQPTSHPPQSFNMDSYDNNRLAHSVPPSQQVDPAFTMPTTEPSSIKLPDLNSLLSKLTAAGLIANSSSANNTNELDKLPNKNIPKQYLPLDVSVLKTQHQFVIDQLYSGVQCTNCSLRFSDEAVRDDKSKKSRYARHLDWHFRQNRREKAKPGSSGSNSTSTSTHRRPWYYSCDLWILFKEVNDDIEEEGAGFFDSNSANSPSMITASNSVFNFDFSQFKDCISEFELFLETITCDTTGGTVKKVCSVLSESDESLNCCAVCNESLDLKWNEEEEEWRLMNAVRFTNDPQLNSSPRIYHPLCLKDYLIQQEKGLANQVDINDSIVSTNSIPALDTTNDNVEKEIVTSSRKDVIPGLDTQLNDNEEAETDLKEDEDKVTDSTIADIKEEIPDEIDTLKDEDTDMQTDDVEIKEENVEIKVVEFEIPILGSIKTETDDDNQVFHNEIFDSFGNQQEDLPLSPTQTMNQSESSISKPAPTQTKRGGIVIKMKKSSSNDCSSISAAPVTSTTNIAGQGNVTATNDDSNDSIDSQLKDEKNSAKPLINDDTNSDNKPISNNKGINIPMDDNDKNNVGSSDANGTTVSGQLGELNQDVSDGVKPVSKSPDDTDAHDTKVNGAGENGVSCGVGVSGDDHAAGGGGQAKMEQEDLEECADADNSRQSVDVEHKPIKEPSVGDNGHWLQADTLIAEQSSSITADGANSHDHCSLDDQKVSITTTTLTDLNADQTTNVQDSEANYFSRGHEISSLCTIM